MKKIDLTGQRFGRLTAIKRAYVDKDHESFWLCKCDCGNEVVVGIGCLNSGNTQSCGCSRNGGTNKTHGETKTRLHSIWVNMKNRCRNKKIKEYKHYGGRGIRVCKEWYDSYETFRDWALANGYADDLSIDRIDVNGNYEPINCRWVTTQKQMNNTRRNHYITFNNETHTMAEWARIYNINYHTLKYRINNKKLDIETALTMPIKNNKEGK